MANQKPDSSAFSPLFGCSIVLGVISIPFTIYILFTAGFMKLFWFSLSVGLAFLQFLAAALIALGLLFVIVFLVTRKRRIKLFLSYNHRDEALAEEVAQGLQALGLAVSFLPMVPRESDDVVEYARNALKAADAVIAIPGSFKDSFSNAEVLAAAVTEKPVLLIVDDSVRKLPNTALSGYPVFYLDMLKERQFRPVSGFLHFIFFHVKGTVAIVGDSIVRGGIVVFVALIAYVFFKIAPLLLAFFSDEEAISWVHNITYLFLAAEVIGLVIGLSIASYGRFKARRTVRQLSGRRQFSYPVLQKIMASMDDSDGILASLAAQPLPIME